MKQKKLQYEDNYFEIKFDEKLNEQEFGNILRGNPYVEQDKIDEVLSHLVTLDEIKKENNLINRNLITKNIDFSISYIENGEKITENLSVPFGMGHFSKGIEHLRKIGKIEYDKHQEIKKDKTLDFLKEKFKALELPPKVNLSNLEKNGWDTLDRCAEILNTISTPELSSFIKNFLETKGKSKDKNNSSNKSLEGLKENPNINQIDSKESKVAEMKEKIKNSINQKKSNLNKEKEISRQYELEVAK